ncbi:MAG: hypothetical protein M0Z41_11195 [Peptococcaceae bacterium]|jgi:hypothetical protein|nr:hypothetical protein [Peptococcaceae bacterium]
MSTAAVGAATPPANLMADIQATLLRKALDAEKETVLGLFKTLPQESQNRS